MHGAKLLQSLHTIDWTRHCSFVRCSALPAPCTGRNSTTALCWMYISAIHTTYQNITGQLDLFKFKMAIINWIYILILTFTLCLCSLNHDFGMLWYVLLKEHEYFNIVIVNTIHVQYIIEIIQDGHHHSIWKWIQL